ncbi:MAG: hypothetical protein U0800_23135 [Isosphaeraceae bacterium]
MTWALCFHCGNTKFGAICPCPDCQVSSTGNMQLDIAFSDHNLSVETIREFGEVVRAIQQVCDDDATRFWSFILYVSRNHPDILDVNLEPEVESRCIGVLEDANPPAVTIRRMKPFGMPDEPEPES